METRAPLPKLSFAGGVARAGTRVLPAEVAVALSYNGSTHAVMMATPADLTDFARGFTLAEGIATLAEIERIDVVETPLGIDVQVWLVDAAAARAVARRRRMAGPVGCGLCGIDSIDQALRDVPVLPPSGFRMTPAQVMAAVAALPGEQRLHDATRAAHCAAFWNGRIALAREDVGRHNALDKLVGGMLRQGITAEGAVVLTSRVSTDMVQKVAMLGAPMIIAVSAPTVEAVELADHAGITLVALARPDRFEVFSHSDRLTENAHVG